MNKRCISDINDECADKIENEAVAIIQAAYLLRTDDRATCDQIMCAAMETLTELLNKLRRA